MELRVTNTRRSQFEPLEHRRMFSANPGATYVQPLGDPKGPAFAVDEAAVGGFESRHQVTFKGRLEGTYSVTPVPNMPPFIVDVLLNAEGNATQLGQFTLVFPHRVDRSSVPSTAIGTYHFTAANGDTLTADVLGRATPTSTPGVLHGVEIATITGGTGRFDGATGGFTCDRLIDTVHFTTVGSFSGTISTVGARAAEVAPTDSATVGFSNQQIRSEHDSIASELLQ